MRVLIILKYIPTADSDRKSDSIFSVIRGHEEEKHSVMLFTSGQKAPCDYKIINSSYTFLERACNFILKRIFPTLASKYRISSGIRNVIKEHKREKIDIILAICTANHPALHAHAIKKMTGIPYVVREHKTRMYLSSEDIQDDYLIALREADALIAVSPQTVEIMINSGIRDDIGVIPNCISDEFFSPPDEDNQETAKEIQAWADGDFIFAAWTRWRTFKRVDLLLEAFKECKLSVKNSKLLIAGPIEPESNKEWVESFIIDNALENSVWLFGKANRDQIHQIAHSIDCYVLPSDHEAMPLPPLEAVAAGKPVVATNCPGTEYIVNSKELGRIVERGNAPGLASAMLEIYHNRFEFDPAKISENVFNRFSRTVVSKQFTKLYEKLINIQNNLNIKG